MADLADMGVLEEARPCCLVVAGVRDWCEEDRLEEEDEVAPLLPASHRKWAFRYSRHTWCVGAFPSPPSMSRAERCLYRSVGCSKLDALNSTNWGRSYMLVAKEEEEEEDDDDEDAAAE